MIRKYFVPDIIFTILCLLGGLWYGYSLGGSSVALHTFFIIIVLGLLEVSLSFDNVIVNVNILKTMQKKRQKRFITLGIIIAVFAMRIAFPIVLVAIFAHITPRAALQLALTDHTQYGQILSDSHIVISGFGGAFLMMVGLDFFLNKKKTAHRFTRLETKLASLGNMKAVTSAIVLFVLQVITLLLDKANSNEFLVAGIRGVLLYILIHGMTHFFSHSQPKGTTLAKLGLSGFLYLELLDASFSLDGVIGAFAISNDIIIIAMGLGIGAFFVRSLTIYMLREGVLASYRYLEHGAYYAIIALATMMLISTLYPLPEVVTGGLGLVFILSSFYSSRAINHNKKTWYQKLFG